ncbi:DUF3099 domain-containing protein [Corynebacterium sp. 335C]
MAKRRGRGEAVLITDAGHSRLRNYHRRRRIYAGLQWSRIPLLLVAGAAFMWWDLPWLGIIFTVLSVPMPWIAVVIANESGEKRDKNERRVYKPGVAREQARREREEAEARAAEVAAAKPVGDGPYGGGSHPNLPVLWVPPEMRDDGDRPGGRPDAGHGAARPVVIDMPDE